jgi:diacylglycerol kinase (ATP)
MPGIGLITNPRSRQNRRDPGRISRLSYMIGSHGTAEATQSLDDLNRACEEFKKEHIDILGISGGDGTLHHTLTALVRAYGEQPMPMIAILRGGTMNTVAASFRIRGQSSNLLFELVDKHRRGLDNAFDVFEREILQISDQYGFIFGNGLIYNFLEAYYATGHPSPPTAAKLVAETIASAMVNGPLARKICRRVRARIFCDGDEWARPDYLTVAAAAVEEIGFGVTPFYRIGERPGTFPVLGIHTGPLGLVAEFPHLRAGWPMRRDRVIDALCKELRFELDAPMGYTIDGDTYIAEKSLTLRLGPKLRFIRLTGDAVGEAQLPP